MNELFECLDCFKTAPIDVHGCCGICMSSAVFPVGYLVPYVSTDFWPELGQWEPRRQG